jgi:hypothetical protein
MIAGLITKDAAGNVLLDTTTAMFRLLGVQTIRAAWKPDYTGSYNDLTGSFSNPGFALGTPFFFYRPASFQERDPLAPSTSYPQISFTVTGTTAAWEWTFGFVSTTPYYVDIAYGVRS